MKDTVSGRIIDTLYIDLKREAFRWPYALPFQIKHIFLATDEESDSLVN